MQTRLFYTTGKFDIHETMWDKPDPQDNEIEVQAVITGVCRSDIDMFTGNFQLLPKEIQGHEGLGLVSRVGKDITDVKEGDIVATRGEPAFSDFYNAKHKTYVKVPHAHPNYIIEPVACGINIARALGAEPEEPVLLLGSGFLASIVYTTLSNKNHDLKFVVVGEANTLFWMSKPNVQLSTVEGLEGRKFKSIIDLSEKPEYLSLNLYAENAKIVIAAEKYPAAKTTFSEFLWNNVSVAFPSPRDERFHFCMIDAVNMIEHGIIDPTALWTKSYDRETEVPLAFYEGMNRPGGYSRGYIEWQK